MLKRLSWTYRALSTKLKKEMAMTTVDNLKGKKLEMISLKRTIVGILVLMIIAFCLAIAAPSVKATPSLTISANGYYDPSSHQYYFIGEVKNVGTTPATDINIRIIAYDTSNNQVDIETPTPEISILNPGAKSPFDATCEDSTASLKIDHFDATIYSSTDSSSLPVGIQVTALNATLNGQSSFITGTLQNTGISETDITNVFATYYNSQGAVVGIATDQTDVLEPGDTSDFNTTSGTLGISYIMPNANISGYTITAESFGNSQGLYTMTESNGGTIPEFSTVPAILLLLAAPSLMLIFSKKAKRPKF
jgi:hypothetical protein